MAREEMDLSERRACRLIGIHRSVARYPPRKRDLPQLLERLKELADERRRYGYRRLTILLQREGFPVNHKRVIQALQGRGFGGQTEEAQEDCWRREGNAASARGEKPAVVHGLLTRWAG